MKNFPTICIDNFYNNVDEIREFALSQDFLDSPGNYPGKRTKHIQELNPDLYQRFCEKIFSVYYDSGDVEWMVETNFWKVSTLDPDPSSPKNMGWIHEDGCFFAGVVYLTPGFDANLGTTIYREVHEKSNDIDFRCMKKFYSTGEDDGFDKGILQNNSRFVESARFNNVYNRLVGFDGKVYHSPSHYYMGDETRLVQVFFVKRIKSNSSSPLQRVGSI
jgi:hypothetical protein